ncbi:glycosyltransferase family 2 protein [Autumnicola edwardsiae]|uniref:Glycosyltransferase n=1 Tax=Autumnicola edwardsiae TaxID=3075594 RepID=A0ABU3CWU7_9FLAO|nr:glycosyltransferase [Zunongwangia sp. F297]MDT0650828.1 glycosyltransferase [Zunongwangia sp. F297]
MGRLISIIIPCYNDSQYIEKAVDSALDQDYENKEVIVVDDGSNRSTKKVLKELKSKLSILVTQENKGPAAARNRGINVASGKYILVLDSDDYFEPSFCTKAVKILDSGNHKTITCQARWFKNENECRVFKPSGGDIKKFLLWNATLSNSMFRKADWQEVGGYDEKMTSGFEDWEFFIRLHANGGKTYVIPEVLFHYRIKDDSVSKKASTLKFELLRYIYFKHEVLYKEHYTLIIDHLLDRLEQEERTKVKKTESLEFRIGSNLLKPFRKLKRLFRT